MPTVHAPGTSEDLDSAKPKEKGVKIVKEKGTRAKKRAGK